MAPPVSPSIEAYTIGKGKVYFMAEGISPATWRDMGNAPTFEFTPNLVKLDHYSSRAGVKVKDKTVVIEKAGTVRLVLDEWTPDNIALAVLGTISDSVSPAGEKVVEIFASNSIAGALKCVGTNEIGVKYEWFLERVEFTPGNTIGVITDEWGQIEISGEATAIDGSFGTITSLV